MPISRSAACTAATASPNDASSARLKLIVAAGNCSSCMTTSGAVVRSTLAITLSGTCAAGVGEANAVVVVWVLDTGTGWVAAEAGT